VADLVNGDTVWVGFSQNLMAVVCPPSTRYCATLGVGECELWQHQVDTSVVSVHKLDALLQELVVAGGSCYCNMQLCHNFYTGVLLTPILPSFEAMRVMVHSQLLLWIVDTLKHVSCCCWHTSAANQTTACCL
jgi:hypothetical protein